MQRVSVGIDGDDDRKTGHLEFPNGLRGAEFFHQIDIFDSLDAFGQHLRRAAYRMQISASILFAGLQGFVSHAALTDDAAQPEIADDLPLIWLLADGGGGAGGDAFPISFSIFDHDWSAMIQNAFFEVDAFRQLPAFVQILVNGVTAGEQGAAKGYLVADLEGADGGFRDWGGEFDHAERSDGVLEFFSTPFEFINTAIPGYRHRFGVGPPG